MPASATQSTSALQQAYNAEQWNLNSAKKRFFRRLQAWIIQRKTEQERNNPVTTSQSSDVSHPAMKNGQFCHHFTNW
ncbi:MAG: hypothetical protein SPJ13_05320 [Bacteroidales bacterium]|nr:hypothetical protein [Bacteroidales bacterium]